MKLPFCMAYHKPWQQFSVILLPLESNHHKPNPMWEKNAATLSHKVQGNCSTTAESSPNATCNSVCKRYNSSSTSSLLGFSFSN